MKVNIRLALSLMMFMEFFIWGAWYVTMGTYVTQNLNATGVQNGLAYGTQSMGAIIAPFIIGLIADRFFSAQKILGVLHLVGAVLMYLITLQSSFEGFYPYILMYMILFMPTLALVNSVAFRQVTNPEKEFALIRVFGTIGWIVAGLLIGWFSWEASHSLVNTFRLTAAASLFMGIYSFFLPDTPPGSKGKTVTFSDIIGLEALGLLKNKNFLIFFISSLLICIPLAFYYQEANLFLNEINVSNAASKMTLGQVSEFGFMLVMPLLFRRLGIKYMLLIGMVAWAVRYVLFGYGDATGSTLSFLYLGILLHGVCYDFFFVIGQIYTDKAANVRIRSAAQGMITLATYGFGMWIGFWIAGLVTDHFKTATGHDWKSIWMVPAGIAMAVAILFAVVFQDKTRNEEASETPVELV